MAAGLIVALLAWLAIRNALVLIAAGSASVPQLPPVAAPALIAMAGVRDLPTSKAPTSLSMTRVRAAARSAPLAAEPFYAAGLAAALHGSSEQALRLMEVARARDPRLFNVHMFLFAHFLQAGRVDNALAEIAAAAALTPGHNEALIAALGPLANEPAYRPALTRALSRNPTWRRFLISYANARGGNLDPLFSAIVRAPARGEAATEQEALLDTLVQRGDYDRAYLAWINFLSPSQLSDVALIYDGAFRGLPGARPFNWRIEASETANAEIVEERDMRPANALAVQYSGNSTATIASQLLVLKPGRYLLSSVAAGDGGNYGGHFEWQLACVPGGQRLGALSLAGMRSEGSRFAGMITVPPGCAAQRLALVGLAGDVASLIEARIGSVGLVQQ